MMTDEERHDIRHRTETLSRSTTVLCTSAARVCKSLADQRAQFAVHRSRFKALVRQQRSLLPTYCPTHGRQRDPETIVLTTILSRLRRLYAL